MSLKSSRISSHPRVRRVSRQELEVIFPSNQRRTSRKSFSSDRTSFQHLTNLQTCPTPTSIQRRISLDQQRKSSIQPKQNQNQNQIKSNSNSKKKKNLFKKGSFRLWCLILSILVGFILLSSIITTVVLLLIKPTTTTTTTSTSQTTATTTTTTSATTSTSTSTSTSSSSTSSTTSSTSTSTSSTSTTSTTSSTTESTSTSSTSTTSTTSTTTTTRNPQLAAYNESTLVVNSWTYLSYLISSTSTSLTLEYLLTLDNKHEWYLDDISVQDSTSNEKIINGDFEGSTLTGWTTVGTCSSPSNAKAKSSFQSYRNRCQSQSITLEQTFNSTIGQIYNISFWFFLDETSSGGGVGSNSMIVNLI